MKEKLEKIEAKIQLGLPLTKKEIAYHILFSKELNMEVVKCNN